MKIGLLLLLIGGMFGLGLVRAQQLQEGQAGKYVVKAGTRIPLVLVNSISTKNSREGDQVYLQTSFPIAVSSRIVIPEGSYVTGTITQLKRPGRIKGRGEMYLRFDSLMLPNGVQRDFRGTLSAVDGSRDETMKGNEGKVQGDTSRGQDVGTVAEPAATGATIGAIAGSGKGAGIGAGVGAAAGLGAVLLTRGPDVRMPRGSSVEMQLDRPLTFSVDDVNFVGSNLPPRPPAAVPTPESNPRGSRLPLGLPFPRPF